LTASSRIPTNADVPTPALIYRISDPFWPEYQKSPMRTASFSSVWSCEINDWAFLKPDLGDFDPTCIKLIAYQDVEDEFEESLKLLWELRTHALIYQRETVPIV